MDSVSNASVPSAHIQFSLRSLLISLAIAAVLLAPVHWFGGFYVVSILLSLGLTFFCLVAFRAHLPGAMFGMAIGGIVAGMIVMSIALALHAMLSLVGCGVCLVFQVRPKIAAGEMIAALVAAYGLVFWVSAGEIRRLNALMATYPMVSLDSRLAFEKKSPRNSELKTSPEGDQHLNAQVQLNLAAFEEQWQESEYSSRVFSLRRLHDGTYRQFAAAAGFGFSRMGSVYPDRIELEPRTRIQLPLSTNAVTSLPPIAELESVHRDANADFLTPERMGYVRDRQVAAGFEPHAFTGLPEYWNRDDRPPPQWQVRRLELVSLLRHDTPQVYIADTLPQMDELADSPHRPLNDFEQNALPKLVGDEDLVVEQQPNRILMLGAVRAAMDCLQCHEGIRGKLLGAFSYELIRIEDVTAMH